MNEKMLVSLMDLFSYTPREEWELNSDVSKILQHQYLKFLWEFNIRNFVLILLRKNHLVYI